MVVILMKYLESIRSTQYTPLFENEKFEWELSQWRLLFLLSFKLEGYHLTDKISEYPRISSHLNSLQTSNDIIAEDGR